MVVVTVDAVIHGHIEKKITKYYLEDNNDICSYNYFMYYNQSIIVRRITYIPL